MSRILVVASFLTLVSCAPRHDLFVEWTIDGEDGADACDGFSKAKVRIHLDQRDSEDAEPVGEDVDADCKADAASVQAANFTEVTVELLSGKTVFGTSAGVSVSPGENSEYDGRDGEHPILARVRVTEGKLTATLTVNGESCGDAGVSSFAVALRENTDPLNDKTVDEATVECDGGEAKYSFSPVHAGTTYRVVASASAGGVDYATASAGDGIVAKGGNNAATVDLGVVTAE